MHRDAPIAALRRLAVRSIRTITLKTLLRLADAGKVCRAASQGWEHNGTQPLAKAGHDQHLYVADLEKQASSVCKVAAPVSD